MVSAAEPLLHRTELINHEETSEERQREIEKPRSEEIAARGQEWEDIERERRKKMKERQEKLR